MISGSKTPVSITFQSVKVKIYLTKTLGGIEVTIHFYN